MVKRSTNRARTCSPVAGGGFGAEGLSDAHIVTSAPTAPPGRVAKGQNHGGEVAADDRGRRKQAVACTVFGVVSGFGSRACRRAAAAGQQVTSTSHALVLGTCHRHRLLLGSVIVG